MTRVVGLRAVYVHVTNACNLGCDYCSAAAGGAPTTAELTGDELGGLWPEVVALAPGKLVITGGEPLARPDVVDLLESYRRADCERRVPCCLNTNGTLVTAGLARRLAPLIDEVRVSIGDRHSASAPEEAGGLEALDDDANEAEWEAIEAFRAAGLEPVVVLPVTRLVLERLPCFLQRLQRRGASRVRTVVVRRTGRARHLRPAPPSYGEVARALDACTGRTRPPDEPLVRHCGAGRFISVRPDGDVYPCYVLDSPEFRLGNIRRDRLAAMCAEDGLLGRLQDLDVEALAESDPVIGERLRQPGACLGEVIQDARTQWWGAQRRRWGRARMGVVSFRPCC